jgi:hypothetical protein
MAVLPLVMTDQGLQPASPADLRAKLLSMVAAVNPDYTANLPGSLVEDISSTDVYALIESDSFLVDLVNSVTPFGANAFLLNQLGILYGVDSQPVTNTSVFVVFTGPPGYVIGQGFVVSDGTYQYICQDGGVIGTDGNSLSIYALATDAGSWPVNPNTVTQLGSSVPSNMNVTVTNPVSGIPSLSGEPISIFRERCFTAGLAASTGMARYLKTIVGNIPGVQNRLISVQQNGDQYVVIVGGGDSYQVAYAIWQADFYTPGLAGATIEVAGVSNTNPVIVYTADNHNLETGDVEIIHGANGVKYLNDQVLPITVLSAKSFSVPLDGTTWGPWQDGGTVSPNPINMYVTINDYPDTFLIPYVNPPQELVTIILTWITNSPNFVSPPAIAQAAVPAIVDYINSLPAGTTPINLNVMTQVFLESIATILPGEYVVDIQWQIDINGVGVSPAGGTQVIFGDRYSYFYTENGMITVGEG